jgi:hypothetical protein
MKVLTPAQFECYVASIHSVSFHKFPLATLPVARDVFEIFTPWLPLLRDPASALRVQAVEVPEKPIRLDSRGRLRSFRVHWG